MLNIKLPIQIATDVANISTHTLLLEISESNIFEKLEKFQISVPEKILEKIQKARETEKVFTFYPENENIFEVVIFFSKTDDRLENRTEIFRKFSKNLVYVPDGFVEEAFEAFVLTMYEFSLYKTKKENFDKMFFVEDVSSLAKLESKMKRFILREILSIFHQMIFTQKPLLRWLLPENGIILKWKFSEILNCEN